MVTVKPSSLGEQWRMMQAVLVFPLPLQWLLFHKVYNFRYSLFFYRDRSRGLASDDGHITIKILADTERSGGSSNIYILEVRQQQYLPTRG